VGDILAAFQDPAIEIESVADIVRSSDGTWARILVDSQPLPAVVVDQLRDKAKGKYHHITSHHITSHHITLHHITSHHITSHHITSHHITSHHITSHHITSHHITSHHITLHNSTSSAIPTPHTHHVPQWTYFRSLNTRCYSKVAGSDTVHFDQVM
jgi:hypothetical protein